MKGYDAAQKIDQAVNKLLEKYPLEKHSKEWLTFTRTVISGLEIINKKALENLQNEEIKYAIGYLINDGYGMIDGPCKDIQEMLEVDPDPTPEKSECHLLEFEGTVKYKIKYKYDYIKGKWVDYIYN